MFRYPLLVRHPEPLHALRAEIRRLRDGGAERIGLIGFSAGGHLAGLAALAPGADPGEAVDFAVLGYAITSMETETYRPARLILLGEDATPELRRATSLDALVTRLLATVLSVAHGRGRLRPTRAHLPPGQRLSPPTAFPTPSTCSPTAPTASAWRRAVATPRPGRRSRLPGSPNRASTRRPPRRAPSPTLSTTCRAKENRVRDCTGRDVRRR